MDYSQLVEEVIRSGLVNIRGLTKEDVIQAATILGRAKYPGGIPFDSNLKVNLVQDAVNLYLTSRMNGITMEEAVKSSIMMSAIAAVAVMILIVVIVVYTGMSKIATVGVSVAVSTFAAICLGVLSYFLWDNIKLMMSNVSNKVGPPIRYNTITF